MSKKEQVAKQEVFPKIPPGYRVATPEEELEIIKTGSAIQAAQSTIARCDAEIRAAKLESRSAQQQLAAMVEKSKELHKKLGIDGVPNDILTLDGKTYILVDKAKREAAALKLIQGGKVDEPEEAPEKEKPAKAEKISDGAPPEEKKPR